MHNAIPARPALHAIDAIEPRAPQWAPACCWCVIRCRPAPA